MNDDLKIDISIMSPHHVVVGGGDIVSGADPVGGAAALVSVSA